MPGGGFGRLGELGPSPKFEHRGARPTSIGHSIGRILEVSGSGLCRALWIQVIRYPLLGMPTQEGGRMVVTESQMAASIRDGAVQDELLHLPEQSLAHLGHHFAEGSHRFFYA